MLSARLISRLRDIDWDFSGSFSDSPFSAIHWHPGRFVSQIPASLIGLLTDPGDIVLDPFAGSGTTVVEAQRLGRYGVAVELNPISSLIIRAKTLPVTAANVQRTVRQLKSEARRHLDRQMLLGVRPAQRKLIPAAVQINKWYSTRVASDLGKLFALIRSSRGNQRILAEAAFSAILMPVCRETRHWGYICDNVHPLDNHEGSVLTEFCRILDRLQRAYEHRDRDRQEQLGDQRPIETVEVICADARQALSLMQPDSVRLVVTSPPYFGVCDYVKAQRLSLEWLSADIEPLRQLEIGARSKRHRNEARQEYIHDLRDIFAVVRRCLRADGLMAVIVGQSSTRAPVLDELRESLRGAGFVVALDMNRRVTSQRRQAPSVTNEHVMILRP
jgi:DNA modification methylase